MEFKEYDIPIVKCEKIKYNNSSCYLTMQERQSFYRILLKQGINSSDAKQRIKALDEQQRKLNKELVGKSDEKIIKRDKLLNELWNF